MRARSRPDRRRRLHAALAVALLQLTVGAGWPGAAARAAEAAAFVAGIEDLPLMPGLAEVADAGVVFDKPSGRIVEAYAQGAVTRAAVAAFYERTLPQLGWRARTGNVFVRERERLSLVFLGGDGDLIVRFTLEPE
ncbi:MAG: hypothetical protein ACE5GS_14805 [Kiloniellaceae bacterium]